MYAPGDVVPGTHGAILSNCGDFVRYGVMAVTEKQALAASTWGWVRHDVQNAAPFILISRAGLSGVRLYGRPGEHEGGILTIGRGIA